MVTTRSTIGSRNGIVVSQAGPRPRRGAGYQPDSFDLTSHPVAVVRLPPISFGLVYNSCSSYTSATGCRARSCCRPRDYGDWTRLDASRGTKRLLRGHLLSSGEDVPVSGTVKARRSSSDRQAEGPVRDGLGGLLPTALADRKDWRTNLPERAGWVELGRRDVWCSPRHGGCLVALLSGVTGRSSRVCPGGL